MMATPLLGAVSDYVARDMSRFHMPGHKGRLPEPFSHVAPYDLTEVQGTDSLYESAEAIAQTEAQYSQLYGTAKTLLSAGGSTLCIQAMLALAVPIGSRILVARNVHTAAINAMALLDLHPCWIYPTYQRDTCLTAPVSAAQVADALQQDPSIRAVYLTSPDYYGTLCDIASIGAVCRQYGVPLLVDNAHGAHLKFLPQSLHPMDLGADICCDSLHKNLPVLTGGALLHIKNPAYLERAKLSMSLFGSTSPSYLIMLSADQALDYLKTQVRDDLAQVVQQVAPLISLANSHGLQVPTGHRDPTRLCLGFYRLGLTSDEFGRYLREAQIEPEYLGEQYCVLLASGHTSQRDYQRLEHAIRQVPTGQQKLDCPASFPMPEAEQSIGLRKALFAPTVSVSVASAVGRISGATVSPCPPGIPLAVPGEKITQATADFLQKYGISKLNVLHC